MINTCDLRVMLLVPQYWVSGTVTFARQLQEGWPINWPKTVIACPTKSGKPSTRWGRDIDNVKRATATTLSPDITGTISDIIHIAKKSFDIIHVTEPDIPDKSRNWWHTLLEQLPIPWTLTLNGNKYDNVEWNRIVNVPTFTGIVWFTPGHIPYDLINTHRHIKLIPLPRPYTLQYDVNAQLPRIKHHIFGNDNDNKPIIGTHCRVAPDKGVASICALPQYIPINVCIDGVPQAGAIPYTISLQQKYVKDNLIDAHKQWTSTLSLGRVHYHGAFTSGTNVAQHHDIHISNTRLGFSAGHEYSLLEAIDAGCIIVQPHHMTEQTCPLIQHTFPWAHQGIAKAFNNEYPSLTKTVYDALTTYASTYDQSVNRKLIAQHHNPQRLIYEFYTEVMSVI